MTDLNEYLLIEQVAALKEQIAALTAERDELREALEEIAYSVKPRGLLARWLVERARGALNELKSKPTEGTTGEQGQ